MSFRFSIPATTTKAISTFLFVGAMLGIILAAPLIDEFHWSRGLASGAFAFGFLVSALISPIVGQVMDRYGPRFLLLAGACLTALGLLLATMMQEPWQLYATLGVSSWGGTNLMGFSVHSTFLPNWFVRRRGMALGIIFYLSSR